MYVDKTSILMLKGVIELKVFFKVLSEPHEVSENTHHTLDSMEYLEGMSLRSPKLTGK